MDREKNALITGASSGIGYELTRLFAHDGYNLVLVARNQKQLMQIADEFKETYSVSAKVISKDLTAASAPEEIFTELQQESIGIDALVNNAGFATYGLFSETDLDAELQLMQVNMVTLTHLTKLFLPGMLNKRTGKILNLASTAAFQPGPLMAVYYATKAYVLSFSEALANELHGTGVSVTALCPGPTESGFQKKANMEDSKLFSGKIMDAQTVARIGYRGLMTNKTVVIPGLRNKILVETVRFSPRKMVTRVVRNMQESVHKS
ncbi:MAG TPA: SDR family oxidoreductase [Ktedonobacteraceae bacterium]